MICVLSTPLFEPTTELVIKWLRSWGASVVRINSDDVLREAGGMHLELGKKGSRVRVRLDGAEIDSNSIDTVWHRRWAISVPDPQRFLTNRRLRTRQNVATARSHAARELISASESFFLALADAQWLGRASLTEINKLDVLQAASKLGLDIPETLIASCPDDIIRFIARHGSVISKPVSNILVIEGRTRKLANFTSVATEDFVAQGWRGGFPSIVQECLKKSYEIRTFYLNGKCKSIAILSQAHPDTSVDFRRYRYEDPNRVVPYALPLDIAQKVDQLMRHFHLDTGSIDFVRTRDDRFVFLEVNPAGQFGMVSFPANYYLEREVAALLKEMHDAKKESTSVRQ